MAGSAQGEFTPHPNDLDSGTRIGRYEIEQIVGRGGMGTVYRAFDSETKREVAIKVLHPGQPEELRGRFLAECEAEAKIRHPHVMPVYDRGKFDDGPPVLRDGAGLRAHHPVRRRRRQPEGPPRAAMAAPSAVGIDPAPRPGRVHPRRGGRRRGEPRVRPPPPRPQARQRPHRRPNAACLRHRLRDLLRARASPSRRARSTERPASSRRSR